MPSSSDNVVRPLGKYEIYSSSRHDLGFYRRVINTCRYLCPRASVGDDNLEALLRAALAHVVLDLPSLRIAIADESTLSPSFVSVKSINLKDDHFELVSLAQDADDGDPQLMRFLEQEHEKLWPHISSQPPWKLTVIRRTDVNGPDLVFDMAFAVHHAITDGGGTSRFHSHFIDALSASRPPPPQLSSVGGILDCSASPPGLAPALEALVKLDVSWLYLAKQLGADVASSWLPASSQPWTGGPVKEEPYKTNLRLLVFPPEVAASLLSACRSHETSLTPVLHALVLASLCRVLPDAALVPRPSSMVASTPISLRPYMTKPLPLEVDEATMMVPMVTSRNYTFDADTISRILGSSSNSSSPGDMTSLVWRIAADVQTDLRAKQKSLPRDDVSGLLPYAGDWHARWRARLDKARAETWEISNLGLVPTPAPKGTAVRSWRLTRAVFSQGTNVGGPAFVLSVAGARETGTLCVALNWQEGVVDGHVMDGVIRELRANVSSLCESGPLA